MSHTTQKSIPIVNCTKLVWEQFKEFFNEWAIMSVSTNSWYVISGIQGEVPIGHHLLTLVTVDVGGSDNSFLITLRFSNLLLIPEISQAIGPDLCQLAALCGNLKLLRYLRNRGWAWDCYTIIDGTEECAKWAYENGCPLPPDVNVKNSIKESLVQKLQLTQKN